MVSVSPSQPILTRQCRPVCSPPSGLVLLMSVISQLSHCYLTSLPGARHISCCHHISQEQQSPGHPTGQQSLGHHGVTGQQQFVVLISYICHPLKVTLTESDINSDTASDTVSDTQSDTESDTMSDTESDTKSDTENDTESDIESDTKSDSESTV